MNRPAIPSDIARKVRQKCGFGCVLCGCPIYDYEHIVEYAIVKVHEEDNLVLLCPTCHRLKTNKLIGVDAIFSALKACEYRKFTSPSRLPEPVSIFNVGSNKIQTRSGIIFSILEFGQLSISFDDEILINGFLLDGAGNCALEIINSHYVLHSQAWDVEYVGSKLTLRDGLRKIFATLTFDISEHTLHLTGKAQISGKDHIEIKSNGIFYKKRLLASHNLCYGSSAGLIVTDKQIVDGHWVTGVGCNHNTFVRARGIAMLNCIECQSNLFYNNQYAMIWTAQFLESMSSKSNP